MKNKKVVYFALATLVALGRVQQAACMKSSSLQKGKRCIECDVCFSLPTETTVQDLQQKLREKYEGEPTERWIKEQPGKWLQFTLQGWEELRKNTVRRFAVMPKKTVSVKSLELSFSDWTQQGDAAFVIRAVNVGKKFTKKLDTSLTQHECPPEFNENPYASCSLWGKGKGIFYGRSGMEAVSIPLFYVLAIDPRALVMTSPGDGMTYFYGFHGVDAMKRFREKLEQKRNFNESDLEKALVGSTYQQGSDLSEYLLKLRVSESEKILNPNDRYIKEFIFPMMLNSCDVRLHPNVLEDFTKNQTYNEVLFSGGLEHSVQLLALAIVTDQLKSSCVSNPSSEEKKVWDAIGHVCEKHKLPLVLLN